MYLFYKLNNVESGVHIYIKLISKFYIINYNMPEAGNVKENILNIYEDKRPHVKNYK